MRKQPIKILQFPWNNFEKQSEGVRAMTQRISAIYVQNIDEVILDGVTRIARDCGITTAIVFDRTAMEEVLRLGLEAYERKENEDGHQELAGGEE